MTSRRGFTLWEMTTVFAVLAVGALIVLPQWLRMNDDAARDSVDALLQLLRDARAVAISERQVVQVHLDPSTGVYRVDTAGVGGTGPLVEGALALGAMESAESERARVRFTFQPSGAASGDTVLVRAQHGTRLVSVDPWNGTAVAHAR